MRKFFVVAQYQDEVLATPPEIYQPILATSYNVYTAIFFR
jgi:hypothetical protein